MNQEQKKMFLAALDSIGHCEIIVEGGSMWPWIPNGARVRIIRNHSGIRPGMTVAFFEGDQLIVHRVLFRRNGIFRIKGDAYPGSTRSIKEERISGFVSGITGASPVRNLLFVFPYCLVLVLMAWIPGHFRRGLVNLRDLIFRTKSSL